EIGQLAGLAAQHVADQRLRAAVEATVQEAVGAHPLVVEDLRQVAAAAVGQQHHDHRVGIAAGDLDRGDHGHAAGAADQQAFLAGQPAGHLEGVGVGDRDDLVRDRGVVGRGPEVLAHALDQVGPAGAAGVDRAPRIGADHLHRAAGDLFEVPAGAGDGAAGAHARDEVGDLAFGVAPDLGTRGLVVALRAARVGVLVRLPAALDLTHQAIGHAVVAVRVIRRNGRRADHHFGAVGAQHVALVLGHLVGADEHALVAALLGHQRQADAGVAGGRLDDGAALLQLSGLLGGLDHLDRDPVLGAAA